MEGGVLPHLTALRLTHNNIEVVEDGAFDGLPSLTALGLSHNPLRTLGGGAFRGLPALRSAAAQPRAGAGRPHCWPRWTPRSLRSTSCASWAWRATRLAACPHSLRRPRLEQLDVHLNALAGLDPDELRALRRPMAASPAPRLLLADNPLRLRRAPLLAWLHNATERVPDARAPALRRPAGASTTGLSWTWTRRSCAAPASDADGRGDEVEVAGPELEASYVFFGLVLALIGLIFLMVLYLNRRGIQRWMRNCAGVRGPDGGLPLPLRAGRRPAPRARPGAPTGSRATSPGSGLLSFGCSDLAFQGTAPAS